MKNSEGATAASGHALSMPSTLHSRRRRPPTLGQTSRPRLQPTRRHSCRKIPHHTTSTHPAPFLSPREQHAQDHAIRAILRRLHLRHRTPAQARSLAHHAYQALADSSAHLQETRLTAWARASHLLIAHHHLPAALQPPDVTADTQMEHHVWPAPGGHRLMKLTHAGHFGLWPVAHGTGWDMHTRTATPLRYLSRILTANTHLGDDWILHAIIMDDHGHLQFLTSQPHYPGPTPGDLIHSAPEPQQPQLRHQQQHLIHHALALHGFQPTTHSPSTYYRPTDNLALFDAHLHNLIWLPAPSSKASRLIPFDVIPMHPRGQLRQNITRSLSPSQSQPASCIPPYTTNYHLSAPP